MHNGHRQRLKRRFLEQDLDGFDKHNILELLLFFGIPQKDTNEIAHNLIDTFGSLSAVFDAPYSQLTKVPGVGDNVATLIKLIPSLARVYMTDKYKYKLFITSSDLGNYILPRFVGINEERVFVMYLDIKNNLLGSEFAAKGSLTNVSMDFRKIIDGVLKYNAVNVVIAHNHPGGIALPSTDDINSTRALSDALRLVNAKLYDHLVVSDNEFVSFKDSNIAF